MSYCFRKNTKNREEMIRSEYDKKYNNAFNPVIQENQQKQQHQERPNYTSNYETPVFQITPYNQKNRNNIYYKFNNTI